jgi:hypothetical protein
MYLIGAGLSPAVTSQHSLEVVRASGQDHLVCSVDCAIIAPDGNIRKLLVVLKASKRMADKPCNVEVRAANPSQRLGYWLRDVTDTPAD